MKTSPSIHCLLYFSLFIIGQCCFSQDNYVVTSPTKEAFTLVDNQYAAPIVYSENDFAGVKLVASQLQEDIERVSGNTPVLLSDITQAKSPPVIVGTLGKSELIDRLALEGKIAANTLQGKWEKFIITIVEHPTDDIEKALVIAGSDKRGTLYGLYDLSSQIGVSPWHFWADVPVKKQQQLYVTPGIHSMGEPAVQYRGIFINDEAPALSGWVEENYGAFNAEFYEKVFQLILRHKGNYLWPAMWGRMFYVDDPKNKAMADLYGIVIGTSHHEPLGRAHAEWQKFGEGAWDYSKNPENLQKFWREGMQRMEQSETIVTVGMRGDGDEPMTEGTAIELLEDIVHKQREIISEVTQKEPEQTPQMWALYKEVQEYYDQGMRVPEDITLLLCDDNWGNIRKLPYLNSKPRKGGYGIYYHFDYVGDPRNYKWINTNQIERTWEQMDLAYDFGATKLWIVNVGDIKPMELPISFFLDYAWNPEKWNPEKVARYYQQWVKSIFGKPYSKEIAEILKKYTKYNARKKPELLSPFTYSLHHYNEANRILQEFDTLVNKTLEIKRKLPEEYQDAYYQLVEFPVLASANLNKLYVAAAKNNLYAQQGRVIANTYADQVEAYFEKDSLLTHYYHTQLSDGKWNHMMSQTHIGYTYWQEPEKNSMPEVRRITAIDGAKVGISVEGSDLWYPQTKDSLKLKQLSSFHQKETVFQLFNSGNTPYKFQIQTKDPWVQLSSTKGKVTQEMNIDIKVDWNKAPKGLNTSAINIIANGESIVLKLPINNSTLENAHGFIEENGYISMEAKNYSNKQSNQTFQWQTIANLGKTSSGVHVQPSKIPPQKITENSPKLGFDFHTFSKGEIKVHLYFSPTINYSDREGLKYGVSINSETPQIVNTHQDTTHKAWQNSVADNIKVLTTTHYLDKPGNHQLYYHLIDAGLVLQKIVIDTGGLKNSYLGPEESFRKK